MKARIKSGHRYSTAVLFSGRIFTKREWADIPAGMEAQTEKIDYLEFEPVAVIEPAPVLVSPAVIEPLPLPINAVQIDDMVVTETPILIYTEGKEPEEPTPAKRMRKGGK